MAAIARLVDWTASVSDRHRPRAYGRAMPAVLDPLARAAGVLDDASAAEGLIAGLEDLPRLGELTRHLAARSDAKP